MVSYSASQCASYYRLLITIPQFSPILVHPLSGEYLQIMAMSVGVFEKEKSSQRTLSLVSNFLAL